MKSLFTVSVILLLAVVAGVASAGDLGRKQTIEGYLVDIACATQRSSELATLGPQHTKKCLTMAQCERSGYAVLSRDLKTFKFDASGNEKAKLLIASSKREKDYRIAATGIISGEEMRVNKLELRK